MPRQSHDTCSIMCSQRMWRIVRSWKLPGGAPDVSLTGCRLGPWAATISREDERVPVVAIDLATYLTVAFPLSDPVSFHGGFADALSYVLEDVGATSERIAIEAAAVRTLPLRLLKDADVRAALNTVDFMCGLELSYATDLRVVQRRLNEFPHNLPPHYVPEVAARSLFSLPWHDMAGDLR